jgi:hypothetical protein
VVDAEVVSFLFRSDTLAPAYQAILAGKPRNLVICTRDSDLKRQSRIENVRTVENLDVTVAAVGLEILRQQVPGAGALTARG